MSPQDTTPQAYTMALIAACPATAVSRWVDALNELAEANDTRRLAKGGRWVGSVPCPGGSIEEARAAFDAAGRALAALRGSP